jgi:hypothetical protein
MKWVYTFDDGTTLDFTDMVPKDGDTWVTPTKYLLKAIRQRRPDKLAEYRAKLRGSNKSTHQLEKLMHKP